MSNAKDMGRTVKRAREGGGNHAEIAPNRVCQENNTVIMSRMISITSSTKSGNHFTSEYWLGGKLPAPLRGLENFVLNSGENVRSISVDADDKIYTIRIARFLAPGDEYSREHPALTTES